MPLFFWIVIGAAVAVLIALIVILAAEIRSNRRFKTPTKTRKTQKGVREPAVKAETDVGAERAPEPEPEETPPPVAGAVIPEESVAIVVAVPAPEPEARVYPPFDNARAVEELGLSPEEADLFVGELAAQIASELPGLETAVAAGDAGRAEEISHLLKGSVTNLGTGGVADLLVAFNTYCKTGNDAARLEGYLSDLRRELGRLREQYGL